MSHWRSCACSSQTPFSSLLWTSSIATAVSKFSIFMLCCSWPPRFRQAHLLAGVVVLKYVTPWGRVQYEVLGSTASYTVFPDLFYPGSSVHFYCTCPAFAYSVLSSESQLMCKHVLATLLAQRLSKCIERPINPNELAAIVVRQCS
ncbi:hypothetical protein AcV5_006940 [Taiwanofungus camphoratus]|nr:hypothetical protein AcV5_006940 [Antrodia cinnamomea]